eukprot:TRINITY_DN6872_c0_g1_i1.p1 TRINITY_DN6872_c0_g1~~TRINITY_DN6872_c0_g1_i1.p1  ORF type:complete len:675 (+),score=149.14 TRINITY_DN6872_c0_g1_i1:215-2026(+)
MASSEQRLIFERPPPHLRKIVLATNMAETSITVNDVVFVVDCGKAKETSYDALNNTPCLLPSWISKASARQRRGRAGRVQPGICYHLFPRCVYDTFAEYQLPELLRTPLQSLCLQIKSLQLGGIVPFLSRALQPPEPLSVENAVQHLKTIGALDDNENLTTLGRYLSLLPVEPKLGKMLIIGTAFSCLDPVLTIAAGLSTRDPFLLPYDKKDLADAAKAKFSSKDYSDHMALVRAYEGWKEAESSRSGYEFCWDNFLSAQTLQAIHSLRKQFAYCLKDSGLLDSEDDLSCNKLSYNQYLVRAIICSGLFPSLVSVVNKSKSISMKTMEDGQVILYMNSVNGKEVHLPCPWLVFFEKVKFNAVVIRDSTAISDSMLLLFGGAVTRGEAPGHLKMLDGYLEFFLEPALAETYLSLKNELEELVHKKLENPRLDIYEEGYHLMQAVQELLLADKYQGKFVFGHQVTLPKNMLADLRKCDDNPKSLLQTLLSRAGYGQPQYKTKQLRNNGFRAMVEFKGMQFVGKEHRNKKLAEKDAAMEALSWLTGVSRRTSHDAVDRALHLAHDRQSGISTIKEKLRDTMRGRSDVRENRRIQEREFLKSIPSYY